MSSSTLPTVCLLLAIFVLSASSNALPTPSSPTNLTIFLTTFNAGSANPPSPCEHNPGEPPSNDSICHWLSFGNQQPDLVVIALQEIIELNVVNYLHGEMEPKSPRETAWLTAIDNALAKSGTTYYRLKHERLMGIFLAIYHRSNRPITEIQTKKVASGLLGKVGSKGAVGISLRVDDRLNISFINAHLTAGEKPDDVGKRNADFQRIYSGMDFTNNKRLGDHQAVFWMGDLNYRLTDIPIGRSLVVEKCEKGEFKDLLRYDELLKEKAAGRIFFGFQEADILFPPTYKYQVGTSLWESSAKLRMPAWCDRILYKEGSGWKVEMVGGSYKSVGEVNSSDHKPVRAMVKVVQK